MLIFEYLSKVVFFIKFSQKYLNMVDIKIFDIWLIIYLFLISQLFNSLNIFAQKVKEDSSELNSTKCGKVEEKSTQLKKAI